MPSSSGESGYALPLALVLVLVAGAFIASATHLVQSGLRAAANAEETARAAALADAAVYSALAQRLASPNDISPRFEALTSPSGFPAARITLEVIDESGKVDLTRAAPDAVMEILRRAGLSGASARAIVVDFRPGPGSRAASLAVSALRPHAGLDEEGYAQLRRLFTIHTKAAKAKRRALSPQLRSLIGALSPDQAAALVDEEPAQPSAAVLVVGPVSVRALVELASGARAERYVVAIAPAGDPSQLQFLGWE